MIRRSLPTRPPPFCPACRPPPLPTHAPYPPSLPASLPQPVRPEALPTACAAFETHLTPSCPSSPLSLQPEQPEALLAVSAACAASSRPATSACGGRASRAGSPCPRCPSPSSCCSRARPGPPCSLSSMTRVRGAASGRRSCRWGGDEGGEQGGVQGVGAETADGGRGNGGDKQWGRERGPSC